MVEDQDDNVGIDAGEQAEVTVSSLRPDVPAEVRSRGRFWYRVVGGVALVALMLTGGLVWLHPTQPVNTGNASQSVQPSDPLAVDTNSLGIPCVDGAAWSPDSKSIVQAGNAACNGLNIPQDETVVTFDAHTGAVRARTIVHVADIQRAIPPPDGVSWAGTQLGYGQPLWSPDGRRIVVTFEAYVPSAIATPGGPPSGQSYARDGIIMLDNRLGAMRILGGLSGTTPLLPGSGNFGPQTAELWDLSAGKASAVTLPMGLAYAWGAGDSLSASDVVAPTPDAPPPAVSSGPVGNPLGGRSFMLWQEGDVYFANGSGCAKPPTDAGAPNYYLMFLSTNTWSPDGRYLLSWLGAHGRLPLAPPTPGLSSPTGGCTNFGAASDWPQLPVHDAGMRAAIALIDGISLQSIQLAWSPDGKHLAVAPGDVAGGTAGLTVYDCASGQVRLRLSVAEIVPAQAGGQPFITMAWSPDSTRLLLVPQGPVPIIHVLGPKSLGG